jgi:rfaE bifunctional protein nucleotidyltransferase chain/domain
VRLATPNFAEALALASSARAPSADRDAAPDPTSDSPGLPSRAPHGGGSAQGRVGVAARAGLVLLKRWRACGVAVTLDGGGALLATPDGVPLVAPARPVRAVDTCGAGDRFAATAAVALGSGALPSEAVVAAVAAATGYVRAGGAAAVRVGRPHETAPVSGDADEVVRRTRAGGGVVVAAGGCFDLLHAGHVSMLEAARGIGDCLVVCVNSDESVRRLKGRQRPLVPVEDRVRVLAALSSVDAVVVFEEDTPLRVLDRIRPDVWVKGGDYPASALPEIDLVTGWGGDVVVVPYLAGRSTTGLAQGVGPCVKRE